MSQQFSEQNFNQEALEVSKTKPVLVDFYADWCGPCKMQAPIIDELAEEVSEKAIVGKLNIDEAQSVASQYKVMSIPTLILFKDGEVKETLSGMQSKNSLLELIKKYTD
jgi:thioredoxin 1